MWRQIGSATFYSPGTLGRRSVRDNPYYLTSTSLTCVAASLVSIGRDQPVESAHIQPLGFRRLLILVAYSSISALRSLIVGYDAP
jgi:hypothetical protein